MAADDAQRSMEELVFECLERIEVEGEGALETMCEAHPAEAQALRARIALLRRMGLDRGGAAATEMPGRLGDFRLIRRLGSGGMGVVYLAEQVSLGREVALKLIRPEQLYFENARPRFRREIDAVARLSHPSIVPIHATGEEGGIPYYAMAYLRGASLAQAIAALAGRDPSELTGRDLRDVVVACAPEGADPAGDLFAGAWREVCAKIARDLALAVQHAHERGVLHRDLKPSNVMIAADGRVVLLDFGLASLGAAGALTRTGSQLGSIPYMSPEQLRGQQELVGERTDVYGIGVTLYELLALRPAFDDEGDTEVLRARILAAAPRPLRDLHRGIGADLALVCGTAMHPEPAARYASAAALALDLENVLALRPIAARAPSVAARLVSWSRRSPARATASALAALLVVGGPLVFGLQQRASNERVAAINVDLAGALRESEFQRGRADLERAAADRNLKKAVDAVDTMLSRVGQEKLRDVPQMVAIRRDLLEDALRFYGEFLAEREGDPVLRRNVELARSRVSSMHMVLGDLDQAERELGLLVHDLRPDAEADGADDETLHSFADVLGRLGEVHSRRGEFEDAEARIREAIATFERIPEARRTEYAELQRGGGYDNLAELLNRRGKIAEAADPARAAVAISRAGLERFPEQHTFTIALGRQLGRLGLLLLRTRRAAESVGVLEEAVAKLEAYRVLEPGDARGRSELAAVSLNLSNALATVGKIVQARALSKNASALGESLVRDFPDVPSYRADLASVNLQLFTFAYQGGDLAHAEEHVLRALELQESVASTASGDSKFHADLAGTCNNLAVLLGRLGRHEEALARTDQGLVHLARALEIAPGHPHWIETVRSMNYNRAMALVALRRWNEAEESAARIESDTEKWASCRAQIFERAGRLASLDATVEEPARASESARLRERALAELERAVGLGRDDWKELADPDEWASLRSDERFEALVARSPKPR